MSIRVMIVEDSAVVREFLRQIISSDQRLEVAAAVESAEEALKILDRVAPDVISLDIRLPGMQGLEATRQIMSRRPTPIVVVSAGGHSEELNLTMEALRAGALSVVEKPPSASRADYQALASRLCTQLAIMSEVKVVRQREMKKIPSLPACASNQLAFQMLGIVASTGGPPAIMRVLNGLGPNFPVPVVVVQHMTRGFLEGFGSWLASVSPFRVEVVSARVPLFPGRVYLAPEDQHLLVEGTWAVIRSSDPVSNQRPSGSVLFSSMAATLGSTGIGVLLTGMGDDGARGLLDLRLAGAYTIAEDESTAAVNGMPAAGVRLGAACEVLPLDAIAPRILELAGRTSEVRR